MNKQNSPQNGSIFFLIFLAIGLFAAVSYAVFEGSRGANSSLTREQSKLAAQEIISFADTVQQTVQQMRLNGYAETEISFGNTFYTLNDGTPLNDIGHNSNCTDVGCEIFLQEGGKVISFIPTAIVANTVPTQWKPGHFGAALKKIKGIGADQKEDLTLSATNLQKNVCVEINKLLGVTNPSDSPPSLSATSGSIYNGAFPDTSSLITESNIDGKSAFCHERSTSPGRYIFYQVLIAR